MGSYRIRLTQKYMNGCNVPFEHYIVSADMKLKHAEKQHLTYKIPSVTFS